MEELKENKLASKISKWYNVDVEAYKIFHELAKEKFEDVSQESESITNKSFKMIGALAAFTGFLIGVISTANFIEGKNFIIVVSTILIIISDAILLYLLVVPKGIIQRGISPELSIVKDFDSPDDKEYQVQLAYYTAISLLQDNIDIMRGRNKNRINLYRWSLNVSLLLILFIAYIATSILTHPS